MEFMNVKRKLFGSHVFQVICSGIGLVSFSALTCIFAIFVTAFASAWVVDQLTVTETAYSPDRKLKAIVFANSKARSWKNVSVLGAQSVLEIDRAGNVFSDNCEKVGVKWIDNHKLVIYSDGIRPSDEKSQSFVAFDRDIQIDFHDLKGE